MNGGIESYDEWDNLHVLTNDLQELLFLVVLGPGVSVYQDHIRFQFSSCL